MEILMLAVVAGLTAVTWLLVKLVEALERKR
jgi:hypothetical protein